MTRNRAGGLVQLWRNLPSVTTRFLVILLPVLAVCAVVSGTVSYALKDEALRTALRARMAMLAAINADALAASVWSFDAASTHHILEAIAINPEIRCIAIADDAAGTRYVWPKAGCPDQGQLEAVKHAIRVREDAIGSIDLHFDYATVTAALRSQLIESLIQMMLLLAGTMVAALIAHRLTIGMPLRRLMRAIRRVEQGRPAQPVGWQSGDEVGRLIAAYNEMQTRLIAEEAALRQSEQRLGLAIRSTRSAVWDLDLRSGDYWWSAEFPASLGYPPGALVMARTTWESLVHPEDREPVREAFARHLDGTTPAFERVYRLRRCDGSWMWAEDKATAMRDDDGTPIRLTGIVADVTERMQAEADLARERSLLHATLENIDQGVVMYDQDLRLVMFNRRAAELLGVPLSFLTARPTLQEVLQCQNERGEFAGYGDSLAAEFDPWHASPAQYVTYRHRRPDGTILEAHRNPLFPGGFVGTFSDVTAEAQAAEEIFLAMQETSRALAELRETQDSLVQAEKMASLGLLVAGIAHEINTPVGIAFGCAGHLANRTRDLTAAITENRLKRSELRSYTDAAATASQLILANLGRAAELIQSFKQVAVDQTSAERRHFELGAYLAEVVTSLGPRITEAGHAVDVACRSGILMNSFPGALSQVATNLIVNALVHASGDRGRVQVRISVSEPTDGEVDIAFADDGCGIPEANRRMIFEPFFTTKRGAGGSGLGLHIVFNLVTQTLGGRISVDSATGVGTTFGVRIPREAPWRSEPRREAGAFATKPALAEVSPP
ncbi:MAG: PAS domain-containing protein [Azospirillum sp.]|nr:PAS domain-containing protein [Azospirillum sp.]